MTRIINKCFKIPYINKIRHNKKANKSTNAKKRHSNTRHNNAKILIILIMLPNAKTINMLKNNKNTRR